MTSRTRWIIPNTAISRYQWLAFYPIVIVFWIKLLDWCYILLSSDSPTFLTRAAKRKSSIGADKLPALENRVTFGSGDQFGVTGSWPITKFPLIVAGVGPTLKNQREGASIGCYPTKAVTVIKIQRIRPAQIALASVVSHSEWIFDGSSRVVDRCNSFTLSKNLATLKKQFATENVVLIWSYCWSSTFLLSFRTSLAGRLGYLRQWQSARTARKLLLFFLCILWSISLLFLMSSRFFA